jgi:hypothetical protein
MNTHADKTEKDKTSSNAIQSVANTISQKHVVGESTFNFLYNRPEVVTQRKLIEKANNSLRVKQLRVLQEVANNSPRTKQIWQMQFIADKYSVQPRPVRMVNAIPHVLQPKVVQQVVGSIHRPDPSAKSKPIQRVQHLWMLPTTGNPEFDETIEGSRRKQEECSHTYYEDLRQKKTRFFEELEWDRKTLKLIDTTTEWNHANQSGEHGGEGQTGRKGEAIWLTSRNDRNAALGYGKASNKLLVYRANKSLSVAVLLAGEQIFPDELVHWRREFPNIDGVFTDHGNTQELVVFDSTNLDFIKKENI